MNDFEKNQAALRAEMVASQIEPRGVTDPRVLQAMGRVARHRFVPPELAKHAYEDRPLPIGHGQTISQPSIVASMTDALELTGRERVLEVGTGCGYQTAILAEVAGEVFSVEIVEPLAAAAAENLAAWTNVRTRTGDGFHGWPEAAPFDAIVVTCAPDEIPAPLVAQLAGGGRMIVPVGPAGGVQELVLLRKLDGKILRKTLLDVRFVPMTGAAD
jgi:protein-L-isoaspartate(D-aspartate) O-methyltransferase